MSSTYSTSPDMCLRVSHAPHLGITLPRHRERLHTLSLLPAYVEVLAMGALLDIEPLQFDTQRPPLISPYDAYIVP